MTRVATTSINTHPYVFTVLHPLRGNKDDEQFCMSGTTILFLSGILQAHFGSLKVCINVDATVENTCKFQGEEEGK